MEIAMTPDEFFTKLWFSYPQDLAAGKKGTKFKAQKACEKIKPEQYEAILNNVTALKLYDRKDQKPDRWPHVSTFINQAYYDREIGSHVELREKLNEKECVICNQPVHGPNYDKCTVCVYQFEADRWTNQRKQALIALDLYSPGSGVSQSELAQRCREHLKVSGLSGMLSPQIKKSLLQPSETSTSPNSPLET